ncbi:MAG: hypothetical protein ACHP7N_10140 [Caulobacterales bacterium]
MKTYTMYLRKPGETVAGAFEPVMCADDVEAMGKARALLAGRPELESVDVFFGDDLLVSVS